MEMEDGMDTAKLYGVITALMTPFDESGEVDEQALRQIIEFQIERGIHGFFPLGTMGLGPALTFEQRQRVAEVIMDQVRGRVPVLMQVGTADTPSSVKLAKHARSIGVPAIASVAPYYYSHSEYEVKEHFKAIADAGECDFYVYNNPRLSGFDVTPPIMARLAKEIPNLKGVKAAFDSLKQHLSYLHAMPPDFVVLAGFHEYLLPTVPLGVAGSVSPSSNFFPELTVELWNAIVAKDYETAFALQHRVNVSSAPIWAFMMERRKWAVLEEFWKARGFNVRMYPNFKSEPLTPAEREEIVDAFRVARVPALQLQAELV